MLQKDYYKVLDISPSASASDIKKSYRRLAHKYHPDKHAGNKMFELKFREIQEAYKILSDEKKRQDYNYTRFDQKHGFNKERQEAPLTAGMILQRSRDLRKRTSQMDPDRMNKIALFQQLEDLVSEPHLKLIREAGTSNLSDSIIDNILAPLKLLNYEQSVEICSQLMTITRIENDSFKKIHQFLRKQKLESVWKKYHFLLALLVALLFCVLIYFISR